MSAAPLLRFQKITERLVEMLLLADKVKTASKCILDLYTLNDSWIEFAERESCSEEYRETWSFKAIREEAKKKIDRIELEIAKLRKLLSSLMTTCLSRTVLDFKSMFRTKVPLLFKNLDDAHITNQISNILRFELSYIHQKNRSGTRKYTYGNQDC